MATVSKYKSILERKKNKGILKFGPVGQSRSGGVVISQKQVQQLLENQSSRSPSPQAQQDLQALASALLDTVNDKNLALSHQRKTNKILGNRVSELEKKIKTLEVSGLWNVPVNLTCLEKLRAECEEVKTMIPRQLSETSQNSQASPESWQQQDNLLSPSPSDSSNPSPSHTVNQNPVSGTPEKPPISLEDLDMLPTRDDSGKAAKFAEVKDEANDLEVPDERILVLPHSTHHDDDEYCLCKYPGVKDCVKQELSDEFLREVTLDETIEENLEEEREATLEDSANCGDPLADMSQLLESLIDKVTSKFRDHSPSEEGERFESPTSDIDTTGLAADVVIESGDRHSSTHSTPSRTIPPTCTSPLLETKNELLEENISSNVDV